MSTTLIDPHVFEALQANAGADFVLTLVEAFAEEAPMLIEGLREAAAAGDAERFETLAHTLKSNGVTFGASRLAEMALQLERQGHSAGAAAVQSLVDALDAALLDLRARARR